MNRKQKKDRRKEVAKIIVKSIGMAALVAGVIIFPGLAHVASWIEKSVNESSPRVRHSYNRMKKRGTIKIVLKDGKFRLLLTKKGQKQFDKYRLEDLKIEKQKVWDNKWRLVMFDIPEAFQASRKSVRDKLITLGFVQVQKSGRIFTKSLSLASGRIVYFRGKGFGRGEVLEKTF